MICEYPLNVFSAELADFIKYESDSLQCPPSFIALPMLCQLASVIGSRVNVSPWAGWTEPAILWGCVVADSGSNKSRALDSGMCFVRELQYRYNETYRNAVLNKNEDEDLPDLERCMISDCTYEALLLALTKNASLIWHYDELGLWFERLKTGTTNNITGVLSLYDGRAQSVTRKTGDNREIIPLQNVCVSVCGTCQIDVLRKLLRGVAAYQNGLAYRFLYAVEPNQVFDWHKIAVDETTYNGFYKAAFAAVRSVYTGVQMLSDRRTMKFCEDARMILRDYLQGLEGRRDTLDAPTIGKARGQIVRMSLVLECLRDKRFLEVSSESLLGAIKLWEYHNVCAQKLIESVSTAWVDQVSDKILQLVERGCGAELTIRDIRNGFCAGGRPSITQTIDILRKLAVNRQIKLVEDMTNRGIVLKARLPDAFFEKKSCEPDQNGV